MSPRLFLVAAALFAGSIFPPSLCSQQPGPGPRPADTTDAERRLANLEKQLDALHKEIAELRQELKAKPPRPEMRVFALKHVPAVDMAKTLQAVLGETNKTLRIVADPQTNSVLVSAAEQESAVIEALINQLDVAVESKKPVDNTPVKPETRIFPLKNAAAGEMARTIMAVFRGADKTISIASDDSTNSVIARGPSDVLSMIEAVVGRLDAASEAAALKPEIRVFMLKNLDLGQTVKVLRDIFPVEQYKTLRLSVSEQTNSIVAAGAIADLTAIEALIVRLESAAKEKKTEKTPETR
jgi:type II secretory pathway component GspD/PulD (secretin)